MRQMSCFAYFLGAVLLVGCATEQPNASAEKPWEFWIQQGDKVFHNPSAVVLKNAAFQVKFRGPAEYAYGVAATASAQELPQSGKLGSVFRFGNGLMIDEPNTKISINAPGVITKGWSSWNIWGYHAPSEAGLISGFQTRVVNEDRTVTLTRNIDQLCIDDGENDRCQAISRPVFGKVHALIAAVPQLRPHEKITDTRWVLVKRLSITFE